MAKWSSDNTDLNTQVASLSESWSAGVFAKTGMQIPPACLQHCLNGDSSLACSQGCAMLQQLAAIAGKEQSNPGTDNPQPQAPDICEKGFVVSLFTSEESDQPGILILRPKNSPDILEEVVTPALETIRSAAAENWHLNQENDELADEVLRSYEQINLIFDVSAHIAVLSDAADVQQMLLTRLRHLFSAEAVFLISSNEQKVTKVDREGNIRNGLMESAEPSSTNISQPSGSSPIELPSDYQHARQRLQKSQRVFVSSIDSTADHTGHGICMWGLLSEGEQKSGIFGIVRPDKPFVSGDMLLLDSALTFGSRILSNLRLVEQLRQTSFEAVRALVNALDQKDRYTSGHSERVGFLAKATGQHMSLPVEQLQGLEWTGLLHDVGKIGIPEAVLNKPGKLTQEEFSIIQGHSSRGYEVLRPVASLQPVLEGVLHHHENPDGSGYPDGLKDEQIPLFARIVHVVDVFDALTSTRSYREAYSPERAMKILKKDAGTKLDAEIVEYFLATWAHLPVSHPAQYQRWFGTIQEISA